MKITLVTPAGARTRAGNRHTALRWAAFLRRVGHRVRIVTQWSPADDPDLLLALHARRSYPSIKAYARAFPRRPLVVALTGTDLYRDLRVSAQARESLELAHRLIVLQPRALDMLPRRLRPKVRVVYQSSDTRLRKRPVKRRFRVCVIGHMRYVKDPLRALAALAHVPRDARMEVVQVGAALDARYAARARAAMAREARYRWLGSLPHHRALAWLASSHALVVSSRLEGGANVVSEAIRIGVPVLASRIPGNVGLLGTDYAGYFPCGDTRALAALMLRCASDPDLRHRLGAAIAARRQQVAPRTEARQLCDAIVHRPTQLAPRRAPKPAAGRRRRAR